MSAGSSQRPARAAPALAPRVPQPSWLADAATVIALVLAQRLCFHVGGDFCIGRQSIACSARTYWRPVCSNQNFSPMLAGKHVFVDLIPRQGPPFVMLGRRAELLQSIMSCGGLRGPSPAFSDNIREVRRAE